MLKVDVTLEIKTLVNVRFANKVIMFEKTLEFKNAIIFYYGKHNFVALQFLKPKCGVMLR